MDRETSGPEVGRTGGQDHAVRRSGSLGILIRQAIGFQGGNADPDWKLSNKSCLICSEYDLHSPCQHSPISLNNDHDWWDFEEQPSASLDLYASDSLKLGL